ncbi:MAG: hypothetical protein ACREC5_06250, partial [Thermoplasmata archaeon]
MKKAKARGSGDRILVELHRDLRRGDGRACAAILPCIMDHRVKVNTIIINPAPRFARGPPSRRRFRVRLPPPPGSVHGQRAGP